jgi:riboflavin-specific deaminase-like protein
VSLRLTNPPHAVVAGCGLASSLPMKVNRLHPDPAELPAEAALASIDLRSAASGDRSHLALNMVASVDGRAALDGRSAALTNPFDRALFHALRAQADAVLVGSRTLSADRYGPLIPDAERRRAREDRGLSPSPLTCVITRSGSVDFAVPLFQDRGSTVLVLAETPAEPPVCPADVRWLALDPSELEPDAVLRRLRAEHGARVVLCEGGPTLNAGLLRAGVVDEVFLTVAPLIAGGGDPLTIVAGDVGSPVALDLRWVAESGGGLFLRYELRASARA